MKKAALLIIVFLALVVYASSTKYGITIGNFHYSFSPFKDLIHQQMIRFIQDIQFKDFKHAATFHTDKEQAEKDIPKMIEKRFVVKPELLDIKTFDVLGVELNPAGDRAKVRTQWHIKLLNSDKTKDVDVIFYWKKIDGKWFMDLQSSL